MALSHSQSPWTAFRVFNFDINGLVGHIVLQTISPGELDLGHVIFRHLLVILTSEPLALDSYTALSRKYEITLNSLGVPSASVRI